MSADIQALLGSIGGFSDKIKSAIRLGDEASVAEIDKLMVELREQFDADNIELGASSGGDMAVAITERLIELGAGTELVCAQANHFSKTIDAPVTLSVARVPVAGRVYTMALHLTNPGAHAVTFWPNIYWNEGTKPEFSASGRDVIAFSTRDGGLTWDAYLLGKAMAIPA